MQIDRLLHHGDGAAEIPRLDEWHPPLLGDMPLLIQADGQWLHEGRPFTRPHLVRLMASLLRQDPEGICLVTPDERWRIEVADCPFLIVAARQYSGNWWLTTQYGDQLCLDQSHVLQVTTTPEGEQVPQVMVRFGLAGRLSRNVYYQLVDSAETHEGEDGQYDVGFWSGGHWQTLGVIDSGEAP
ncbi:DUF1285 domain-containing protein [Vreelandella aquamarina]|uniref:DUF1285 domain-containing protein n=1 Tax=Vreelandella aquamarina TaxID=77097 RepID=UPI00384A6380